MRNAQHERDAKDLGLEPDEMVSIARVTRSVRNRLGMSRDHAGGDDALQVVHFEIWQSRALLASVPQERRQAWINTLVVRAVLRHHDQQLNCALSTASLDALQIHEGLMAEAPGSAVAEWLTLFASGLADAIEDEHILRAVLRLHPRDYRILDLHVFLEVSNDEGGEVLGISAGAFARRRQRILARLRADLVRPPGANASLVDDTS